MKTVIFVTDFLPTEIVGGAELTFDALYKAAPEGIRIQYMKSEFVKPSHWLMPDVHWILGNYTRLSKDTIESLCDLAQKRQISYSIVEFDYKYCVIRNEKVHNYQIFSSGNFGFCNCPNQPIGTYTKVMFGFAEKVHFMSEEQMNLILKRLPELQANKQNFRVQWSTWNKEDIDFIESIYKSRNNSGLPTENKYAIQKSSNWLKGTETAVKYAEENNLEFDLIDGMEYHKFLETISKYKGFIFFPNAYDTCPRVVIEARLLGLDVVINENVQINQELQTKTREEILEFISTNAAEFWKSYQL